MAFQLTTFHINFSLSVFKSFPLYSLLHFTFKLNDFDGTTLFDTTVYVNYYKIGLIKLFKTLFLRQRVLKLCIWKNLISSIYFINTSLATAQQAATSLVVKAH